MQNKKVHVIIKSETFSNFTGVMVGAYFENGKTVEPIPYRDAQTLGAIMEVETDEGQNPNPAETMWRGYNTTDADQAKRVIQSAEPVEKRIGKKAKVEQPKQALPTFTRDELEAIADKSGIAGLRKVGETFGIKARSIEELIEEILAAQEA